MSKLTQEEMDKFLKQPRISMLASVGTDNSPHVTPVWHHYDGNNLMVLAEPTSIKIRNLRLNPKISLLVATVSTPHMFVLASGTATLSDKWDPKVLWRMSIDYKGQDEGELYAAKTFKEMEFTLVSFSPSKMTGFLSDTKGVDPVIPSWV